MNILNKLKLTSKYIPSSSLENLRFEYRDRLETCRDNDSGSYFDATRIFWLNQIVNLLKSDKVLKSSLSRLVAEQDKDLEVSMETDTKMVKVS